MDDLQLWDEETKAHQAHLVFHNVDIWAFSQASHGFTRTLWPLIFGAPMRAIGDLARRLLDLVLEATASFQSIT